MPQPYPRIGENVPRLAGCIDLEALVPHTTKIPYQILLTLILNAIANANDKVSRDLFSIPEDASTAEVKDLYFAQGKELISYFKNYVGDPASTAYQIYEENFREVCIDLFRRRSLQNERMNSGWRYQFLSTDCARRSGRFLGISDLGSPEGDFTALIAYLDENVNPLSLYVSVKNRSDTMGGQDWPKAIRALEAVASGDRNRRGAYCCIFGIAMETRSRTERRIPRNRSGQPHSINTEIWYSNLFWPFFSDYSYEEIMLAVLDVLLDLEDDDALTSFSIPPEELIEGFGEACRENGLIDDEGVFNDPIELVSFFVQ